MIFNSIEFLILLIAVFSIYWFLKRPYQNILLLSASYFFYAYANPFLLLLLLFYTGTHYFSALGIKQYKNYRKFILIIAIIFSLFTLGVFKYFNFFIDSFVTVLQGLGFNVFTPSLHIILPVGISFYAFQTMGYTIDVYKGDVRPRKNLLDFCLFTSFFPQLIAGPIERAKALLPQIEGKRKFQPDVIFDGLNLIIWGFFKKVVIADNVAGITNKIFLVDDQDFWLLWVGVFSFAIQIFADFSAYTDIARGTAKLFGINLSENFRHPYLSRSPADFWRRWHITLSFWFRDYVYIPLGGSRRKYVGNSVVLLTTFFLTGLWHGAGLNFIIWGLYNGLLIQLQRTLGYVFPRLSVSNPVSVLTTFTLITFGWLFFRETEMVYIIKYLTIAPFSSALENLDVYIFLFLQVLAFSIPLWIHAMSSSVSGRILPRRFYNDTARITGLTCVSMVLFIFILTMANDSGTDFIYFQF